MSQVNKEILNVDASFLITECRLRDPKKLNSSIRLNESNLSKAEQLDLLEDWTEAQQEVIAVAKHHYKRMIDRGVAPEVARLMLPMGLAACVIFQ